VFAVVFLILRRGWADTQSSEQQDCTECKGNGRFHGWQYISSTAQRLVSAVIVELESNEKAARLRDKSGTKRTLTISMRQRVTLRLEKIPVMRGNRIF